MFFFDPLWFMLMVPPLIFMIYAQVRVSSIYKKYSRVANGQRMSGAQVAQTLLSSAGLRQVGIERTKGRLN